MSLQSIKGVKDTELWENHLFNTICSKNVNKYHMQQEWHRQQKVCAKWINNMCDLNTFGINWVTHKEGFRKHEQQQTPIPMLQY